MSLQRQLGAVWSRMLDLLFPPRCAGCSQEGAWFCPACRDRIEYVEPPICPMCGRSVQHNGLCRRCRSDPLPIEGIRSVAYLAGPLRLAIHAFKYSGLRVLAPDLGQILTNWWGNNGLSVDIIIPVPLHRSRARWRGYNQSAILAKELGSWTGLPVAEDSLLRTRATRPQVELGAEDRRENVANAFACRDSQVAGRKVLLIDDVCTTGATLSACAMAARGARAAEVWALTLAREGRTEPRHP